MNEQRETYTIDDPGLSTPEEHTTDTTTQENTDTADAEHSFSSSALEDQQATQDDSDFEIEALEDPVYEDTDTEITPEAEAVEEVQEEVVESEVTENASQEEAAVNSTAEESVTEDVIAEEAHEEIGAPEAAEDVAQEEVMANSTIEEGIIAEETKEDGGEVVDDIAEEIPSDGTSEEAVEVEVAEIDHEDESTAYADSVAAGPVETSVQARVQPEVAPGPSVERLDTEQIAHAQEASEIQPGEKPDNITPQLRADMYHNRFFAALSYIPLGFLVVFALKNESRFCIYHARQGLALFFAQFIGSLLTVIPYFGLVAFGFTLFLSIIGIVSAVRANDYFQFPVIGPISEKMTFI